MKPWRRRDLVLIYFIFSLPTIIFLQLIQAKTPFVKKGVQKLQKKITFAIEN
jgi:hypothetical protein